MQVLTAIDPNQASGPAKDLFESIQLRLGRVPNMLRLMANSPVILESYLGFTDAFQKGRMTARLRGLLTATMAELTGGDYIMSFAYVLGRREGLTEEELAEARRIESSDARTRAALQFAAKIVNDRGRVAASEVEKLRESGYSDEEIVEIIAFVGLSIFRNYFNLVAGTEIDFPPVEPDHQKRGSAA
jgi:alkylhydroperoxidase family enzyme